MYELLAVILLLRIGKFNAIISFDPLRCYFSMEKREQENKQLVVEQRVGVAIFLSISYFTTVLESYDRISKFIYGKRDACQYLFKYLDR